MLFQQEIQNIWVHTCPCRYIETFIWMCLVYSADPPPLLIRKCTKIYQSIMRHKQLNGNEKKEAKKSCNNNKNVHLVYKTILLHPLYVRNVCVFHNLFIAGVSCCCVFFDGYQDVSWKQSYRDIVRKTKATTTKLVFLYVLNRRKN